MNLLQIADACRAGHVKVMAIGGVDCDCIAVWTEVYVVVLDGNRFHGLVWMELMLARRF